MFSFLWQTMCRARYYCFELWIGKPVLEVCWNKIFIDWDIEWEINILQVNDVVYVVSFGWCIIFRLPGQHTRCCGRGGRSRRKCEQRFWNCTWRYSEYTRLVLFVQKRLVCYALIVRCLSNWILITLVTGGAESLNFLRNLPQFQLMRSQVQAHPETLPQLLQDIGQSNPQLLQVKCTFVIIDLFNVGCYL